MCKLFSSPAPPPQGGQGPSVKMAKIEDSTLILTGRGWDEIYSFVYLKINMKILKISI